LTILNSRIKLQKEKKVYIFVNTNSLFLSCQVLSFLQSISKPQPKSSEAVQREIEEAMSRVKETQSLVSAAVDPLIGMLGGILPSGLGSSLFQRTGQTSVSKAP